MSNKKIDYWKLWVKKSKDRSFERPPKYPGFSYIALNDVALFGVDRNGKGTSNHLYAITRKEGKNIAIQLSSRPSGNPSEEVQSKADYYQNAHGGKSFISGVYDHCLVPIPLELNGYTVNRHFSPDGKLEPITDSASLKNLRDALLKKEK